MPAVNSLKTPTTFLQSYVCASFCSNDQYRVERQIPVFDGELDEASLNALKEERCGVCGKDFKDERIFILREIYVDDFNNYVVVDNPREIMNASR